VKILKISAGKEASLETSSAETEEKKTEILRFRRRISSGRIDL
jgi:hypothetical protein